MNFLWRMHFNPRHHPWRCLGTSGKSRLQALHPSLSPPLLSLVTSSGWHPGRTICFVCRQHLLILTCSFLPGAQTARTQVRSLAPGSPLSQVGMCMCHSQTAVLLLDTWGEWQVLKKEPRNTAVSRGGSWCLGALAL